MTEEIIIDRLKQENEILKEKLEIANNSDKRTLEILQENKHLNDLLNQALKEQEELRVALEEIREMCNKHLDAKEICYATQVIDKINEVLK